MCLAQSNAVFFRILCHWREFLKFESVVLNNRLQAGEPADMLPEPLEFQICTDVGFPRKTSDVVYYYRNAALRCTSKDKCG